MEARSRHVSQQRERHGRRYIHELRVSGLDVEIIDFCDNEHWRAFINVSGAVDWRLASSIGG